MFGGSTGDVDHLVVAIEGAPAVGRAVASRVLRIDLQQHQIAPVGIGVGEAPGHLRVTADNQGWNARQRDADQPQRT